MLLLLLLESLDPLLPRLLLTSQHILQRLDLLLQLLLRNLKLSLYCRFLDFYVLIGSLKLDNALVQVLDLPGPLVQLLVLVPNDVLQRPAPLLLLGELELGLVPDLVRKVKLLDGVVEVEFALIVELPHLFVLD